VDVHVHQVVDAPISSDVDRTRAEQLGLTQSMVASNLLFPFRAPGRRRPIFGEPGQRRAVPRRHADSPVPHRLASRHGWKRRLETPRLLSSSPGQRRRNHPDTAPAVVSHYNVQPVFDSSQCRRPRPGLGRRRRAPSPAEFESGCLAAVSSACAARCRAWTILSPARRRSRIPIVLVYLLMVINFQSWLIRSSSSWRCLGRFAALCGSFSYGDHRKCPFVDGRNHVRGVATAIPSSWSPSPTTAQGGNGRRRRRLPPGIPACARY